MPIPLNGRYRVHFVFTTLGYHPESTGGAFRYVAELAEGLARRSHRVEAIFPCGVTEAAPSQREGVTLYRMGLEHGAFWRNWIARNRLMREHVRRIRDADPKAIIVSCHGYFARSAT